MRDALRRRSGALPRVRARAGSEAARTGDLLGAQLQGRVEGGAEPRGSKGPRLPSDCPSPPTGKGRQRGFQVGENRLRSNQAGNWKNYI